jgi:hypothetical protein
MITPMVEKLVVEFNLKLYEENKPNELKHVRPLPNYPKKPKNIFLIMLYSSPPFFFDLSIYIKIKIKKCQNTTTHFTLLTLAHDHTSDHLEH